MNRPIDTDGIQRNERTSERPELESLDYKAKESVENDAIGQQMADDYLKGKNVGKISDIQRKMHEVIYLARSLEQEDLSQQARKSEFIGDITKIQAGSLHSLQKAFE